jgi:membrane-anchored glycerophosphoryl diester phosphodiesterase (GDPDase)
MKSVCSSKASVNIYCTTGHCIPVTVTAMLSKGENIFREVIKWISCVFLCNTTLFWNLDCISNNKFTCHKMYKCKFWYQSRKHFRYYWDHVYFAAGLKNELILVCVLLLSCSFTTSCLIIKVVMCKNKSLNYREFQTSEVWISEV